LLSPDDARREAEEFLSAFEVLYPNEAVVRTVRVINPFVEAASEPG
jgi:hypothetical protein